MTVFGRYVLRSLLLGMLAASLAVSIVAFWVSAVFARSQSDYVFVAMVLGGASLWLFGKLGGAVVFAGAGIHTFLSIAGGHIFGDGVFTFSLQTAVAVLWLVALFVATLVKPKIPFLITSVDQARELLENWIRAQEFIGEIRLEVSGNGLSADGYYDFRLNTGGEKPWNLSVCAMDGSVKDLYGFAAVFKTTIR